MDIIYYNDRDTIPLSFCLQTRVIAQVAHGKIQSKTLNKQEASLLFLLLTKALLPYKDAEQATEATIDDIRHIIMPHLNVELAPFHLEVVAVLEAGFALFDLLND